jgi:hypothetical protein
MGDRVSISFRKGRGEQAEESVALFSHWGGIDFVRDVAAYLAELAMTVRERNVNGMRPIDRFEPRTVIVDCIRAMTGDRDLVSGDLYLGKDATDGDNSDNGHFTFDLDFVEKLAKDAKNFPTEAAVRVAIIANTMANEELSEVLAA